MKTLKSIIQAAGIMLLMLVTQNSFAGGITFQENKSWKELLALAKKQNKIIFLDAYATWCGPCKYLQNNVFTQSDVATYYNASFINAAIDMEAGEGPTLAEEFGVTAYPTLFFINGDGKLLHKYVGALEATELIALGKDAANPAKQYYTLKDKAAAGQLSLAAMLEWAEKATTMKDKEAEKVVDDYINAPNRNWLNKDMLTLVFDHAGKISDAKMQYIKQHKAEIIKLLAWTEDDFNRAFKSKANLLAVEEMFKGDEPDFEKYKATMLKYVPNDAELETRKVKIKYAFIKENAEAGVTEMISMLDNGAALNLSIYTIADIVIDNAELITQSTQTAALINKILAYQLGKDDIGKDYYKHFAAMVISYYKDDKVKAKEYAQKIIDAPGVPENISGVAEKVVASE
ncbi:MAG: DUF255 domain-containing protein [Sphingobacteriaceae bacterium]|nr:MAG: DUF255 domain-containing protein [Sphingobacteriaceae bacterium]